MAERQIVDLNVRGSIPLSHPKFKTFYYQPFGAFFISLGGDFVIT